jgi:hypothetical protein
MFKQLVTTVLLVAATVEANAVSARQTTLNGPCKGKNGVTGVCVSTASCTADGGSYISNACLGTPENIKCCTKPSCQRAAQSGDCRWTDQCDGGKTILTGLCPGPAGYKCCVTSGGGGSPPPPPPKPPGGGNNIGEKVLAKAKEAEGLPCKLIERKSDQRRLLILCRQLGRR